MVSRCLANKALASEERDDGGPSAIFGSIENCRAEAAPHQPRETRSGYGADDLANMISSKFVLIALVRKLA
jgi:hypothetical protein